MASYPFSNLTNYYQSGDLNSLIGWLKSNWLHPTAPENVDSLSEVQSLDIHHSWLFAQYARFFETFSTAASARRLALEKTLEQPAMELDGHFYSRASAELFSWGSIPRPLKQERPDSLLAGKSVLLAGPNVPLQRVAKMAGDFDYVAVANPQDLEVLADAIDPAKTILYLNHERSREVIRLEVPGVYRFGKVVTKSRKAAVLSMVSRGALFKSGRAGNTFDTVSRTGHLSANDFGLFMGTVALYDLIGRKARSIEIVGFSMYLPNTQLTELVGRANSARKLRLHEPASNFAVLKKIVAVAPVKVTPDRRLQEILDLSYEKYAEQLDIAYPVSR